jgi:putative spermidine/putrescine transport system permease protein
VQLSRNAKLLLGLAMALALAFVYLPLALVVLNSFNTSLTFEFPPPDYTTRWWGVAVDNQGVRDAIVTSLTVATIATVIAVALGTLAAMAVSRYTFFGRDTVSLLLVLPIALPGIVTGLALNSVFTGFLGGLTFTTLVVGHATFCIVVVFNNAAARLRRVAGNVEEASMDLGASRMQTFRYVTFPAIRSSIVAGALLAFGLSFDEIIVTVFTAGPGVETLPIWIFNNLFRPNQAPVVNVVAAFLVIVSILPIWASQKLTSGDETVARLP